jgi:hypothetical protein
MLAREWGERGLEAWSLRLLAEIHSHAHALDEQACGFYDEARDIAGTLGMRPIVAHCDLSFGKLNHHTRNMGRADQNPLAHGRDRTLVVPRA